MRLGVCRKMKLSLNSMPEAKKASRSKPWMFLSCVIHRSSLLLFGAQPAPWKSGAGEARQQLAEPQAEEHRRLPTAACHEALQGGGGSRAKRSPQPFYAAS